MKKLLVCITCLLILFEGFSQKRMSVDDQIINSTIKIETVEKKIDSGKVKYARFSGTGFIFSLTTPSGKKIPLIVTNRHVIENSLHAKLYFKLKDSLGFPIFGKSEKILFTNFSSMWIMHPDSTVDLAVCPLIPIINDYKKQTGKDIFFIALPEEIIPTDSIKKSLMSIEDIFMIGYPYGLRDTINDLPIVRKGITATPIALDYNSKKEFLIDMPVYFGSSGSPILIYNHGSWSGKGTFEAGTRSRVILVGINYATYTRDFDGKIIPKASTNFEDSMKIQTNIPLYNIGIIIKAERLLDFKQYFKNVK